MNSLMVILDRYIAVDGVRLRIGGAVTRDVAHYHGVPHGAVQVAVVVLKNGIPHLLLHKRSAWKKTAPNLWDICGGHIDADARILANTDAWEDQAFIADLFAETALREANEEVSLRIRPNFRFASDHLHCFGGLGVFTSGFDDPAAQNREHSAFYAAFIPPEVLTLTDADAVDAIFEISDSVNVGGEQREEIALELKLMTLPALVQAFRTAPESYASGIRRVLSRALREPGTMAALTRFLIH